jgi:2-oxoglutarate ferredoxin oxidoreductase subunit beta
LAIAIAAGANYVARGFSGDPNGLADLIGDGIRWPGFAFIEVLSPCVTFRPEQREWKKMVRPSGMSVEQDRAAATARRWDLRSDRRSPWRISSVNSRFRSDGTSIFR